MNWNNVDLNSHEREANILDPYSFDILLLEIHCNLKDINRQTVERQFEISLNAKIESAKEVFRANLNNILKQATKEREA